MKTLILTIALISNISFAADSCRALSTAEKKSNISPACKAVNDIGYYNDLKNCEKKSTFRRLCTRTNKDTYIDATMVYGTRIDDKLDCRFSLNKKNQIVGTDCSRI